MTLRGRETLVLTTVVFLAVVVATIAHLVSVANLTTGAAAEEGKLLARQIFHQSAGILKTRAVASTAALRDDARLRSLLEGMVGYSRLVVFAAIADPSDRAVIHSDPAFEGTVLPRHESLEAAIAEGAPRMVVELLGPPRIYEVQLPLRLGDRPFGTIRVGISTALMRQELLATLTRSAALAALALVVALAIGLGAGRVLLHVLRRIAYRVERLRRERRDVPVEPTVPDAIGALADRVNRLGERIQVGPGSALDNVARSDGAIDRLEDGVIVLGRRREVLFCNQAAGRLLGRNMTMVRGRRLEATLPRSVVTALFGTGIGSRNRLVTVPPATGPARELVVSSYRLRESGRLAGAVFVLRDLEPVRAVDSLVSYSQKLAALGRLTSGMAHEVKNPLNAMRIHLELLRTRLPDARPELTESFSVIVEAVQRLDRVVQGFLTFMRPHELRLEKVDVNALLADVARLTGPEALEAQVEIVLDVLFDLPPVIGDAELLRHACTNLVANAVQAMPSGGKLTLSSRLLREGRVEIRVRDEGVGIAPEDRDRVFRLYYTTKEGGSGIGLSLVYRVVQLHDGTIDVDSSPGDGTTMIVTLPLAPAEVTL